MKSKNYTEYIKDNLIKSPVRMRLGDCENVPFKELIIRNLDSVMEDLEIIESKDKTTLKIVIVGEVKSGKSSLLNALVSLEVSEVDVLESTSKIIEVVYDKDKRVKKDKEIVRVGLDLEYLKKINFVDTPGLKSITVNNEMKTMNYIQNADLILFVIDATHLGQEDVEEALEVLFKYRKPIVGIVNKCDLLQDSLDRVLDYVKDEYELYIDEFFMISSYLEFQSKISDYIKAGDTDLVIYNDKQLKDNFARLIQYIDNVYQNSEIIKSKSMRESIHGIVQKDIVNHYDYLKSANMLIDELKKHEKLLGNKQDYIIAKMDFEINDWLNRSFLQSEVNKIINDVDCTNLYINENYINDIVNKKKMEFDKIFFNEWSECLQEVNNEIDDNIKKYMENINYRNELLNAPHFKLECEKVNVNDMLLSVGTGAILGATSGTVMSIYAASIGTSAATVTMGGALMTYCPPLLIAGTVTGAIGKILYDKIQSDKKNKEILRDIEEFRETIKYDILNRLKDGYEASSNEIVGTTTDIYKKSKGIYITKYEIENLLKDIDSYIEKMNSILKE